MNRLKILWKRLFHIHKWTVWGMPMSANNFNLQQWRICLDCGAAKNRIIKCDRTDLYTVQKSLKNSAAIHPESKLKGLLLTNNPRDEAGKMSAAEMAFKPIGHGNQ